MTNSALAALESDDAYIKHLSKNVRGLTDVIDDMRKSGKHVITYTWPDFEQFKLRSEKSAAFQKRVKRMVEKKGYLVMFGRTTVVICWDTNFAPVTE